MNVWFCAGSSTSSSADAGSPRKSAPSLSISSSIITGIARAGLAQLGDDAAGHRADVRAAVAADVGLVAHAAQGDADELAAHRFGDDLAERRLAHARRADEAQDRAAAVGFELAHGQIFDDAAFDLVQIVMIAIENLRGLPSGRSCRRSSIDQGSSLTICSYVRMTPYSGEALGIASSRLSSRSASFITVLGQLGGFELLRGAVDFAAAAAALAFAQLLADRLQLLLQVVAALALVDVLLDLRLDLGLQLQHVELRRQPRGDQPQALFDVQLFEHPLLFGGVRLKIGRQEIRQRRRVA